MTYSHAKVQDQWSVGSEGRVETNGQTDGRTDGGNCIISNANMFSITGCTILRADSVPNGCFPILFLTTLAATTIWLEQPLLQYCGHGPLDNDNYIFALINCFVL